MSITGVSSRSNLVAPTASSLAGSSSKFRAKKLAPANVANTRTVAATRSSTSSKRPSGGDVSRETSRKSKRRKKDADVDVDELQCASYALELLSHGGLRNHVIGALVSDNSLQLLYYDRSIILISEPFDFIVDHSHLVITLNALAGFNARQWGYALPPLEPAYSLPEPRDRDRLFDGLRLTLKNGRQLRLMDTIFHQHSLIGRGTCVVRATCVGAEVNKSDGWEGTVIVKFSWPSKSRMAEPTIIEEARQMAVESGDTWVLDHLPMVLYSEDTEWTLLSPVLIELLGNKYEKRVLRIMVQEELFPITDRRTAPELAVSFREIFRCMFLV